MSRFILVTPLLLAFCAVASAQTRDEKVRGDRSDVLAQGHWIYNDLEAAFSQARQTGKPLLIVFRCVPCEACAQIDAEVVERDARIRPLLEQFVCVRVVYANSLDLSLFQFDFDQSWTAFMMGADKTIYGRYGTRSHQTESKEDVSLEGFSEALRLALALHQRRDAWSAALAARRGEPLEFAKPEEFPMLRGRYTSRLDWEGKVAQSCVHCHQVGEAQRHWHRSQGRAIPDKLLFPYPHPKALGLALDPTTAATVKEVAPDSPAAQAGFRPGDRLMTLQGQPLISMADIQWVLHHAPEKADLAARVMRDGQPMELTLRLDEEWRRRDDISWRATTWDLRRMFTGGMVLKELTDAERRSAGLDSQSLALRVHYLGQFGEHAGGKNAGFLKDDVIISVMEQSHPMRETDLIAFLAGATRPGKKVPTTVLRGGREVRLTLPMR